MLMTTFKFTVTEIQLDWNLSVALKQHVMGIPFMQSLIASITD